MGETVKFLLLHFKTMKKYYVDSVFKVMYIIGENPFSLAKITPVAKETNVQDPQPCLTTGASADLCDGT